MKQKTFRSYSQVCRGFTLIEILVVIALIGMLATIVIGGISNARTKSADTSIKTNLQTILLNSQSYYEDHNKTFGTDGFFQKTVCPEFDPAKDYMLSDEKIRSALDSAMIAANGAGAEYSEKAKGTRCYVDTKLWAISVPLKSDLAKAYCVDSQGASWTVEIDPADPSKQITPSECGPKID